MTAGAITVRVDGSLAIWRGWKVSARLREAGLKPVYLTTAGGYAVDAHRLADALAYFESRRIAVVVEDEQPSGGDAA